MDHRLYIIQMYKFTSCRFIPQSATRASRAGTSSSRSIWLCKTNLGLSSGIFYLLIVEHFFNYILNRDYIWPKLANSPQVISPFFPLDIAHIWKTIHSTIPSHSWPWGLHKTLYTYIYIYVKSTDRIFQQANDTIDIPFFWCNNSFLVW